MYDPVDLEVSAFVFSPVFVALIGWWYLVRARVPFTFRNYLPIGIVTSCLLFIALITVNPCALGYLRSTRIRVAESLSVTMVATAILALFRGKNQIPTAAAAVLLAIVWLFIAGVNGAV